MSVCLTVQASVTPVYPVRTYPLTVAPHTSALRLIHPAERVFAAVALIAFAPIGLITALLIWVLSGQRPLIWHQRVGWRGVPLRILKFRTMWGGPETPPSQNKSKPVRDPRVTSRFAAFCRRCSLDEMPQLYHVARGEMALVGPRPITRAELDMHYGDDTQEVLSVRPGLTGLWQIMGRSRLTYAQRRRLDLILVRRFTPALYLRILLRSIPKVLTGVGAW